MVNSLYASAAGTVSFDFRDSGRIRAILLSSNGAAAGAAEISFNSTSSLTTTDTTGVIGGMIAGGAVPSNVSFVLDEPVDAGERLYMHSTGATIYRAMIITESTGAPAARAAVRRR